MTTPHTPDDERLPGEDELSSLYRKLPSIEPPAALDAAVRRAAAEAVKPAVAVRRRARWPVALSSAAALVVAAGLAWRMGQMPSKQDELREAAAQHEAQTVATQALPSVDHEPTATRSSPSLQAPPKIIAPPEPAKIPFPKAQAQHKQMVRPQPPLVEEASSNPVPAPPPAPPAPPAPPSGIVDRQADGAMKAAPEAAPAVADRAAQVERAFQQAGASSQSAPARRSAAPMPTQAMPAPMAPPMTEQAMPAPALVNDMRFNKASTPEQELQKIRSLFANNQRDDARKRLADFHRDHPDYELPADLREQLLQP
jgi:Meckel syndrome type 1 protein